MKEVSVTYTLEIKETIQVPECFKPDKKAFVSESMDEIRAALRNSGSTVEIKEVLK